MKYSKAAAEILKNFYSGKKVLMDTSDPNSILVCFNNMSLVKFPELFFPFNTGMFEKAELWKIVKGIEYDYSPGVKTNRMITIDKKTYYEVFDEMGRSTYIDSKLYDSLGLVDPIFRVSTKSNYAPVLIYEEQFPDEFKAAICPVNVGL